MTSLKSEIEESIKCMICLLIVKWPKICPKCSAFACEQCIKVS